jgi:hypothetical protein
MYCSEPAQEKTLWRSTQRFLYDFVVEESYACNTCTKVKILRGKKQILEKKYIGKVFLADYTDTGLSFAQTECFDLVFDESVLFGHVFEKKSFLIFNSENLLYSFAIKENDFSENC